MGGRGEEGGRNEGGGVGGGNGVWKPNKRVCVEKKCYNKIKVLRRNEQRWKDEKNKDEDDVR